MSPEWTDPFPQTAPSCSRKTIEDEVARKMDLQFQDSLLEPYTIGESFLDKYPNSTIIRSRMKQLLQKAEDATPQRNRSPVTLSAVE